MIVFAEPSAGPAEMIMRIRALLISVVVLLAPFHMMAEEARARSMLLFDQLDLRGSFFVRVFSPPFAST
jgi:hypothetical protein